MSEKSEKCLKKRKYDSKYKSGWASEFAGVVKGSEETMAKCTYRNVLLELFILFVTAFCS